MKILFNFFNGRLIPSTSGLASTSPVSDILYYPSIPQMLQIRAGGSFVAEKSSGVRIFEPGAFAGKGLTALGAVIAKAGGQLSIEAGASATALGA